MKAKPFTLIEILVAIAIFVSAMTPLLMVMAASSEVYRDNLKKTQATLLASEQMAIHMTSARSGGYSAMSSSSNRFLSLSSEHLLVPAYSLTTSMTESGAFKGLYHVAVGWHEANHLGLLKFGVSYRNPSMTRVDLPASACNLSAGTITIATGSLSPLQEKFYRSGRYLLLANSTESDIVNYASFDGASFTGIISPSLATTGTIYLLDEVFTLWLTDL